MRHTSWRVPLLIGLAALVMAVWWTVGRHLMMPRTLASHYGGLRDAVAAAPLATAAVYVAAYAAAVAVSLPLGGMMTLAGGLMFGTVRGGALATAAATLGAALLFLLARTTLGRVARGRAGPLLARIQPGLERDGVFYLLALRLVPLVPFWLTNLAPALAGMRLGPFVAATVVGILPATFVFASVGAGLGQVLEAGGTPDLAVLRSPGIVLPLLGLAALSLVPVVWRRFAGRRRHTRPAPDAA